MSLRQPNETKRKMPRESVIRRQWADRLWLAKGYDSAAEFMECGHCFACGFDGELERAHVLARCVGGDDGAENLHMLCKICHKDSEGIDGAQYMDWLIARTIMDRAISSASRIGVNVWALMQENTDDVQVRPASVAVRAGPMLLGEDAPGDADQGGAVSDGVVQL